MTEQEVNKLVNNLYELIASKKHKEAANLLAENLEKILTRFKTKPTERPIEYDLVEYLFFKFNQAIIDIEDNQVLDGQHPLNSYLVQCFENPAEIQAILFHLFEFLHPDGHDSYSRETLLESIQNIRAGQPSILPAHTFEFDKKHFTVKQNGKTHIVSI